MLLRRNGPAAHQKPTVSQAGEGLVISLKATRPCRLMSHDLEKPPRLGNPSLQPTNY